MSTNTRTRKRTPKKPRPTAWKGPQLTLVDLRRPLPARRTRAVGSATPAQLAEGHAALAAAWCRLLIPALAWHALPGTGAAARIGDTLLVHHGGHTYSFTAWTPCPMGAHHAQPVTSPATLHTARLAAADCTTPHTGPDAAEALTRGVQPPPAPEPPAVTNLAQAFRHDAERTQELNVADLRAAAADTEQPKEHPVD
ncbi:hypothetical protein [Streptomyces lavendofoliae]|uniref:Uncharacterized protein n=1 Tax=Streptomyces lavendofoliae TaxID=67314 RepID=A0A918M7S3_9ACTN|nr:hypothetical protein [Streptomyces lavendofoliae]GGU62093.1 hypothetical protein GCM10010274_58580 [Streptomyces lavendofoliae]